MPDGSLIKIIVMLICLAFSAFFSASETAFTSFNHTKMKNLAAEGSKRAALVLKMSENFDKLLSTILVGNNIVNILLSGIATIWFVEIFKSNQNLGTTVATVVTTVVVLIFGEISPKSLAKEKPERFSMAVARTLRFITGILTPINWFFMLWKKLLTKIFKPAEVEAVTEGELLTLVDEAHEDGSIDEYDKELIENIFDFDDISAAAIATHRTEMTMLPKDASLEEWAEVINASRFSRYPIYGEDVDDIIGILDTREYFRMKEKTKEAIFEIAVKPAYFVPENVKADVLFRNMKEKKESLAIVLDEYGGVHGIVTVTDLVECLVGEFNEITEEENDTPEAILLLNDNRWQINGLVTIADVEDALGVELTDADSDTFSGFVMGLYGSIPEDGSTFELSTDLLEIQVLDVQDHKVESAIVTIKESIPEDESDEEDKTAKIETL